LSSEQEDESTVKNVPEDVDVVDYHMHFIQHVLIKALFVALDEHPFEHALNLGGGDDDDWWFRKLWLGKIQKATFFDIDGNNIAARKKERIAALKRKEPSHSFALIAKTPVTWRPMFRYEVVTGVCFLGRLTVED
jgi:hypothetical protein